MGGKGVEEQMVERGGGERREKRGRKVTGERIWEYRKV